MPKGFPPIPGMPTASKGVRIDVAENGFVVYLRKNDHSEETRIASSVSSMWYMVTNYLRDPIPTTELPVNEIAQ